MNNISAARHPYQDVIRQFDWNAVDADLGWSAMETVDLGWTLVDRHCAGDKKSATAVHWISRGGEERLISYDDVSRESARYCNLLQKIGVAPGDRVATILSRRPETMAIIIGTLRAGAILVPIFSGFGADAVAYRLEHSETKVVCVDAAYRGLLATSAIRPTIVVGAVEQLASNEVAYHEAIALEAETSSSHAYRRDEPAAIIYTSGSTGNPKGCVIAANLSAAIWPYVKFGLDLRADSDTFWPTGDPSWGYGLCCYLGALAIGGSVLSCEANASAAVCLQTISRQRVSNLATTPTVLRDLMASGEEILRAVAPPRAISSCGEPLNDAVVGFFQRVWGVTPMDHFGATEFGLPIGNHNGIEMPVKPGSMGLPSPGQTMAIVDEDGAPLSRGDIGLIAQRVDGHSLYWLRYWNDTEATASRFRSDWICTGDLGKIDADGYFWFEGRTDDIIKSAGYRIGPFEIESAVLKHGSVVEAAVIGVPDDIRGQAIKLFVVLAPSIAASKQLEDELVELVRETCGRHQYPRQIAFVDALPKTETGKIQRFRLRHGELAGKVSP